jgi:ATP-dependent helicase/DNAse subunit B
MSVSIHHLGPGSEEAKHRIFRRTIEEWKGPDFSGILYLAPTYVLATSFKRTFHSWMKGCYIPPRCMTLKQFSRCVYLESGTRPILPAPLVPVILSRISSCSTGLASLRAELIRELKEQFPSEPPEAIRERLRGVFQEKNIPEDATKRAMDAMEAFVVYQDTLTKAGFADEQDVTHLSTALAQELSGPELLLLDGFYEVHPSDLELIHALTQRAQRTIATIPVSGMNDDLSYCYSNSFVHEYRLEPQYVSGEKIPRKMLTRPSASMEAELEAIAREIKENYISGRARDLENTLVVFPDITPYRKMAERVFARYGIPATTITPQSLSKDAAYLDLLALLESVGEDYPRLPFSRFLASPHFQRIPAKLRQAAPHIALTSGILKGKEQWLHAFRREGAYSEGVKLFKSLNNLTMQGSYMSLYNALLSILRGLKFSPGSNGLAECEGLLRRTAALESILGHTDLKGFWDAVSRLLDSSSAPGRGEGVKLASLHEVRGLEPEVLYLAGMKDDDIPSRPEMDFLLPDSVRRKLGLMDLRKHMHLEEYIFGRLASSAGRLSLSYPTMEGDRVFLPSVFLSETVKEEDGRPQVILSEEEEMLRDDRGELTNHIREVRNIKGFYKSTALRVTDIDSYRRCPRRFFIERTLGLCPPEVTDYEVEPMTLGSIVHRCMEELVKELPRDEETFLNRAEGVLETVLREFGMLDDYFKALISATFLSIIPKLFENELLLREEGYDFHRAELEIEGEPVPGIRLAGKVDRIDKNRDGEVEVIDYKTGSVATSSTRTLEKGADLQLYLYASMLKEQGLIPRRVGLYSLRDLRIKWFPTGRDTKKGLFLDDFILRSVEYLEDTAESMGNGSFEATPIEEQVCRSCHERPYCPYIQGGGAQDD